MERARKYNYTFSLQNISIRYAQFAYGDFMVQHSILNVVHENSSVLIVKSIYVENMATTCDLNFHVIICKAGKKETCNIRGSDSISVAKHVCWVKTRYDSSSDSSTEPRYCYWQSPCSTFCEC